MVNKIARFFKSIGKSSSQPPQGSGSGGFAVLPSTNDNQYFGQDGLSSFVAVGGSHNKSPNGFPFGLSIQTGGSDSLTSPPKDMMGSMSLSSRSGSNSSLNQSMHPRSSALKWGPILSKIPKIITSATNGAAATPSLNNSSPSSTSSGSPGRSASNDSADSDLQTLLDLLSQMANKEYQLQIMCYYAGKTASTSNDSIGNQSMVSSGGLLSNNEHRKVFKQCRRSLLLCWKYIIAQLNDNQNASQLADEKKETYHQLIGLIAERPEFNLNDPAMDLEAASTNNNDGSGQRNQKGSRTPGSSSGKNDDASSDEGTDAERDLYLYRCLLVATFKYVAENLESAKSRKRAWISLAESRFFARVLAVCFYRIPFVQRAILDTIYPAYCARKWLKSAPVPTAVSTKPAEGSERMQRRRSSSKPWSGPTFSGTLNRWNEFEGKLLMEDDDTPAVDEKSKVNDEAGKLSESSSCSGTTENTTALPNKNNEERFKRLNPTLFSWSKYAPYLGPYSDNDVFRMNESVKATWLEKLCCDGEFYSSFMASVSEHADHVAVGDVLWHCLPGYPLLVRIALLLVKEAAAKKWQHLSHDSPPPDSEPSTPYFALAGIRQVRTVLDNVAQLLRNRELLDSCVLAMFEHTNVLSSKSVGVCLTRFEEWFSACAVVVGYTPVDYEPIYRVSSTFNGHSFAIGIRIMLASENFEVLNRVLLFLYNRMDYFEGDLRQAALKALVQRHMYLFLHWNDDVRKNYHHILVFKVVRVNRYALDSIIDQLLVGRYANAPIDSASEINVASMSDGEGSPPMHITSMSPHDVRRSKPRQLTSVEYGQLRMEQALWRAFDACIASICVQERRNAREGNRRYQNEIQAARCRAIAFLKLNRKTVDTDDAEQSSSNPNEGLPGAKPWHEVELLEEELNREPPYYLRYLPAEEVSSLDELRRLASSVKYPSDLQIYAAPSLRSYSDLLKQYYQDLSERGYVEAPPLGFC
ncbi:TPA: hypothetical protein N0F65_011170 [Lagenidium giganteum]|uniref:Uncharacterized protein n=1 Tax=Lagenidium giganteum TaxID=4803 RepID=A0AAV2ZA28_9STRA|nr:TPA: hypothetical protein N0F65_011170 [Lagenidium giganteum]